MTTTIKTIVALSIALLLVGCGGTIHTSDGEGASEFKVIGDCPADLPDGSGCISQPVPPDAEPPEKGGCWVTGIGTFGKGVTRDSFGGNAMTMKDGRVRGEWQHVDHFDVSGKQKNGQNIFHGKVEYIECRKYPQLAGPQVPKAEPNFARWGGRGRFNGVDGYTFEVKAFDHAEGGIYRDRYAITIKDADGKVVLAADGTSTPDITNNKKPFPQDTSCRDDIDATGDLAWVKDLGCLSGGNFQIHPPNKGHPY